MRTTAAPLVVRALEDEGVRFAFGIPGTHNIELYDALETSKVAAVLVTDEQCASFMADGVSRSSGSVGVVNLVPGAGLTHALSGIAEAFMDGVPLVVLMCGIRTDTGRAFQLHAIDQTAVVAPVVKAVLHPERISEVYPAVRQAFALARAGCPGPVAVEIAANLYLIGDEAPDARLLPHAEAPAPDPEAISSAAALLSGARRVLVYAGYGTRGATGELRELVERLSAPVATTIQGKGVIPEDHPLFLWNTLGRAAPAFVRDVASGCDAMLAIGCRFAEVGTASYGFEPPANLVHVDIDPAVIGRNFPVAVAVVGDAGAALRALLQKINPKQRDYALEEEIARGHAQLQAREISRSGTGKVTPGALFGALRQLAGRDAIFVTDSGNGTFLAMEHLRLKSPGQFLAPVDFSCMGYSIPAAIGAKLANPDRDVIALAGDGALLMTGLELVTAAAYGAGVVACVLRDRELAQIAQFQRTSLARATASVLHPYDLDHLASAVGAAYLAVDDDADVMTTLERALASGRAGRPVVVEVAIDYSEKTHFTRGVVTTNLWRLPWRERVRVLARAVARHLERR